MSALTYDNLALGWKPENKRDNFFNRLTVFIVILAVIFGYVMMSINLPKEERKARTVIPERVAKFILQKEKPKVIKVKPKPKPKPPAKRIVKRIKKKTKSNKPLTKTQKKARKKAESSGLLALNNELSDLMDTSSISAMVGKRVSSRSSALKVASVNTKMLTANAAKGSGGVSKDKYSTRVSKTVLSQSEKIAFRQSLASNGKLKGKNHKTRRGDNVRSEEDVIFVMDQNKSKLHSIYRRARRAHPGLKGKIILEITIAPSGKVLKVRIKSSELNDPKLESRLVARIKRFDFGSNSVEEVTVLFPIEFLPS